VLFNVAGMVIALGCLAFSHYVLDLRSARADNISANGVGLVLGTLFRFWAYRYFVFRAEPADDPVLAPHDHGHHGHHGRPQGSKPGQDDRPEPAGDVTPAGPPR